MSSTKKRAVVICPGRGSYNKEQLGYLAKYHSNKTALLDNINTVRLQNHQLTVNELDQKKSFDLALHTSADNASSLIYACAHGDYLDINRDEFEIVAVTGNSMGWYIALAVAQALDQQNANAVINGMGQLMAARATGGQLIYPVVNDNWHPDSEKKLLVEQVIKQVNQKADCELYLSIDLGGYWVLAGNDSALNTALKLLPPVDDIYPMKLFNHGAYHTPIMNDISKQACNELKANMFNTPRIPLIDGTGQIWQPYSTDVSALYRYTLQQQVTDCYSFRKSIEVSIKEFAPDNLILLGPGSSLGGAVAQNLIMHNWQDLSDKQAFIERQKIAPFLLAMGISTQRKFVV